MNSNLGSGCADPSIDKDTASKALQAKLENRPAKDVLLQHNVLKDASVSPALQERKIQLEKQQVKDLLNRAIVDRPGPMDLVKESIMKPVFDESISQLSENNAMDVDNSESNSKMAVDDDKSPGKKKAKQPTESTYRETETEAKAMTIEEKTKTSGIESKAIPQPPPPPPPPQKQGRDRKLRIRYHEYKAPSPHPRSAQAAAANSANSRRFSPFEHYSLLLQQQQQYLQFQQYMFAQAMKMQQAQQGQSQQQVRPQQQGRAEGISSKGTAPKTNRKSSGAASVSNVCKKASSKNSSDTESGKESSPIDEKAMAAAQNFYRSMMPVMMAPPRPPPPPPPPVPPGRLPISRNPKSTVPFVPMPQQFAAAVAQQYQEWHMRHMASMSAAAAHHQAQLAAQQKGNKSKASDDSDSAESSGRKANGESTARRIPTPPPMPPIKDNTKKSTAKARAKTRKSSVSAEKVLDDDEGQTSSSSSPKTLPQDVAQAAAEAAAQALQQRGKHVRRPVPQLTKEQCEQMRLSDIREILKQRNLTVSGNKDVLIQRLLQDLESDTPSNGANGPKVGRRARSRSVGRANPRLLAKVQSGTTALPRRNTTRPRINSLQNKPTKTRDSDSSISDPPDEAMRQVISALLQDGPLPEVLERNVSRDSTQSNPEVLNHDLPLTPDFLRFTPKSTANAHDADGTTLMTPMTKELQDLMMGGSIDEKELSNLFQGFDDFGTGLTPSTPTTLKRVYSDVVLTPQCNMHNRDPLKIVTNNTVTVQQSLDPDIFSPLVDEYADMESAMDPLGLSSADFFSGLKIMEGTNGNLDGTDWMTTS
eukprot:Clim_evm48s215 gene=Clim_evmTU48s215